GVVTLTNAAVRVDSVLSGAVNSIDGRLSIVNGEIATTNSTTVLGSTGPGQLTSSNSTALFGSLIVGSNAVIQGSVTSVGSALVVSNMTIGYATNSFGSVQITGGQLILTNGALARVGNF